MTLDQALSRISELEDLVAHYRAELGIDQDASQVAAVKIALTVSPSEARILIALYRRAPKYMSKASLLTAVHGGDDRDVFLKIVDVWVCRIRAALSDNVIETVWGCGYALTEEGRALVRTALESAKRIAA